MIVMEEELVVEDDTPPLPPFPRDVLGNREYVEIGKQVFDTRELHGVTAYVLSRDFDDHP
ncbi:MAG: hypothetical protein C5B46_08870 [Proteobacteria bacterium]|nr:MAG: hypothetical protein C5B46_08870 [Pseudomonadota bacterium]